MHSNAIEEYKKNLKLNKSQKEIIVGLMLGDGHLETQNKDKTYRLKIEYSEKQKEYLYWLWEYFKNWAGTAPKIKEKIIPSGIKIKSISFNTYSHGAFRFYAHQFYKNKKKVIPKIIRKLLTPRSIAVWFMDDGSWKSKTHRTYIIHVDGYQKDDLLRIQSALIEKFGVETSIQRQYDNWRIYIKTSSAEKFRNLIKPYIVSSMEYKLGNI